MAYKSLPAGTTVKNPSEGMFRSLISLILCNLKTEDLDFDAVQRAIGNPKLLAKGIAELVNNGCVLQYSGSPSTGKSGITNLPTPTIVVLDFAVDPAKTTEELKKEGCYTNRDKGNITNENFPNGTIAEGKELVAVCFHYSMETREEVSEARAALGIEAVTSPGYILTVGIKQPTILKQGSIVDIDSRMTPSDCRNLGLSSDSRNRILLLDWTIAICNPAFWVLGLRNKVAVPLIG